MGKSHFQSTTVQTEYPNWVMGIGLSMIIAGVLPIPLVYLLRRFQILKVDLDIHQGSIRRNETTASTKQMMDDDDVSRKSLLFLSVCFFYSNSNNFCVCKIRFKICLCVICLIVNQTH